ncbi:polyketide synthase dehydratase domain-containing protein [Streptomyces sp. AD16]|nr:polyketide synthase dehydratase domain-containing protein [Streptomyces sp. AD16]
MNVFARRDSAGPWARHAGARVAADPVAPGEPITAWPPAGAVPVELGGLYERLAAAGLEYGPAFRGVEGVWRDERSGEVFTEVRLAQSLEGQADQYLVHPALLDTVLHAVVAADLLPESEATRLPFSFTGVTVHAVGASLLRVRLTTAGPDGVSLAAWDVAGDPVLTAEAVVMRPVSQDRLRAALSTDQDSLFQVAWQRALSDPAVPAPATWGLLSPPPARGPTCPAPAPPRCGTPAPPCTISTPWTHRKPSSPTVCWLCARPLPQWRAPGCRSVYAHSWRRYSGTYSPGSPGSGRRVRAWWW